MSQPEDRAKVLTELTKNLVVEAGAGTGKTTLLITRLCEAVLVQEIPVEKLVALTFTEKAAAEIKTRFIMQLHQVIDDLNENRSTDLTRLLTVHFSLNKDLLIARAQQALARLDRASMGTIHSFCADILKTFPLEAGLAPQAEIDSGQKADRLFEARWHTFLDQQLGRPAPRQALCKRVLLNVSLPDLKQFARELCRGKVTQYDYFSHAAMLAALCEEKSRQAQAWSTAFLAGAKKPRNTEKALAWAAQSLLRFAAYLRGQEVPPALEAAPAAFAATANKGWDEETFEQARSLVEFAQKVTPENQQIFRDAWEFVRPVVEQVRQDYEREGILSFDDLIVKTRDLLQRDAWVRRLVKEKFDFLCIDEFQDTDPIQGELLLFLAEEKASSAARWQEVRLAPGKLFVVGDPKQSIYRFRGADITAYELFTDLILKQGGEKCFLQKNFRSTPDIVALANTVCSRAMVQQTAFQPAYVPIFPAKESAGKSVSWLFVEAGENAPQADDYRHNQGEQIARWIKQNVGNLRLANGRKLAYGDIAILARASTTSGPYVEALRRHGIAFNVETDKDFYRKQEVNDFLNFLRVVANPQDTTALAGVLRSPWGGFTDEEIYQIVQRNELSLSAPVTDERLAYCYQCLRLFVQRAGRTSLHELLLDVLEQTFLPESCAAAYESERTLASLQRLVGLAKTYQTPLTLASFLSSVQDILQNEPERLGASAVEEGQDAVSVMTVHKSKGLGFPVVILVDLSKREAASGHAPAAHVFSWQYNMHGLRVGAFCDANLAFLEEEQKKHARCEEVRILYVALTRAQEKMILVADGRKGAQKAAGAFAAAGLLPTEKEQPLTAEEIEIPVQRAAFQPVETFRYRTAASPEVPLAPETLARWKDIFRLRQEKYKLLQQEVSLAPSEQVQRAESFSPQQRAGALVGAVCHRVLEQLLTSPHLSAQQALQQADLGAEAVQDTVRKVITDFTQSPLWQEIKNCRTLATEMPFTLAENSSTQSGIIDVVLEQPDGAIWVVDYKTDQVQPSATKTLLEKYRPQLTVYAQAARRIFPSRKIRVSAVFVRAFAAEDL